MHTTLLNIGFVPLGDNKYINYEIDLVVEIIDAEHVLVPTPQGNIKATIAELEDAIVSGGFGEF